MRNVLPGIIQDMLKRAITGDESAWAAYKQCRYNEKVNGDQHPRIIDAASLHFLTAQLQALSDLSCVPKPIFIEIGRVYCYNNHIKLENPEHLIPILKQHIHTNNRFIHWTLLGIAREDNDCMKHIYKLSDQGAKDGDRSAQHLLGLCYHFEAGTKKDDQKAFQCIKQALTSTEKIPFSFTDEANMDLGLSYEKGLGVPKNPTIAMQYYQAAANNQHSESLVRLGNLYQQQSDYQKAAHCYEQAMEQDRIPASRPLT